MKHAPREGGGAREHAGHHSLLMRSAAHRLGAALGLVLLLWLAVAWALAEAV